MKLGGIRGQEIHCTRGYATGVWAEDAGFVSRGTLPTPGTGLSAVSFSLVNSELSKRCLRPVVGGWTTTNLWPLSDGNALATVGRQVFRSSDGGRNWVPVHRLPPSSGPMGVLPTSVCPDGSELYLAEYPLGDEPARICHSDDGGRTWNTYLETTGVRHFHGVFRDPYEGGLWATAGDTDAESAIGRLRDGAFQPAGGGSQRWRAVGLAFTPSAVVWGMDCSYVDNVAILRLDRDGDGVPVTVGTTDASVYYAETVPGVEQTFVVLTTAAETGTDQTVPTAQRRNECGDVARVLVASSRSEYEEWHELAAFERRRTVGSYVPHIPTASAYVFIDADPERGLVLNPFNTRTLDGELIRVSIEQLRRLTSSETVDGGERLTTR